MVIRTSVKTAVDSAVEEGLPDVARRVIGCQLSQETRFGPEDASSRSTSPPTSLRLRLRLRLVAPISGRHQPPLALAPVVEHPRPPASDVLPRVHIIRVDDVASDVDDVVGDVHVSPPCCSPSWRRVQRRMLVTSGGWRLNQETRVGHFEQREKQIER